MYNALTILIPLKDRHKLTDRLLSYFSNIKFPYKIILADGSKTKFNSSNYSKLRLKYVYYGYDATISKYIKKMSEASKLIDTPLTMICDADDLISLNGIMKGVKFLADNTEYSAYCGAFINWANAKNMYHEPSLINSNIFERLNMASTRRNSRWNDIIISDVTKSMFNICEQAQTNDLQCLITLNVLWPLMFGNAFKCQDIPFYYHMPGPSIVQGTNTYHKFNKWYHAKSFSDSVAIIVSAMSNAIYHQVGSKQLNDIRNIVLNKLVTSFLNKNNINNKDKINNCIIDVQKKSLKYDAITSNLINIKRPSIVLDNVSIPNFSVYEDMNFIKHKI
ncbi:MAG TPA: TIGR00180 family glycosyltransferase [Flavobacteriaceae bacterium]|nr:TIGR00180 family glycosyltransferase [Flavobacteriaceae bacterium]